MAELSGKVVLVTEVDTALGLSVALHFAKEHARLALCGSDTNKLENAKHACDAEGTEATVFAGSLENSKDLKNMVEQPAAHYGRIDVVVPIVGPVYHGTVETVQADKMAAVLQRNVTHIIEFCQYATPHLAESKGNMVVINSLGGIKSFPKLMPHCVAAAALDMFIRCTSVDLGRKGIRVNSVCPGMIKDKTIAKSEDDDFSQFIEMRPHRPDMQIPLGSFGSVDHVAYMAVFLSSQDASFMTGTSLPVDGGVINVYPR